MNPSGAVFETAGNANYYLAPGSPYRDAGTTNIDPDLLAELQTMTTYAPQDGGWPDTNTPDLGYHYPVNEDSDYDGLPDWWEWKYFGTFSFSGTDLDCGGVFTLLYDYQHGLDPNITNNPNIIIVDSDQTNMTFQSNLTYYVTGEFGLYGTTTFEGGTVIKIDKGYNGGGREIEFTPQSIMRATPLIQSCSPARTTTPWGKSFPAAADSQIKSGTIRSTPTPISLNWIIFASTILPGLFTMIQTFPRTSFGIASSTMAMDQSAWLPVL